MKQKILVIFPEYSNSQSSHYPYWYRVFEKAGKDLNLVVLFETGSGKPDLKNVRSSIAPSWPKPFNLLARFFTILYFVNRGYRSIYIHYSYWSVILVKLLKFCTPITIYYWNCEAYPNNPHNALLSIALHATDHLVTGAISLGETYKNTFKLDKKSIQIIPNWSEHIPVEKIALAKDQIHILFVHHISPRKGSRDMPDIIRETLKVILNTHFHIIGDGPDKNWLQMELIAQAANVTFYNNLPLPEVRRYFASCDYFIMPSRSEGFPRVVLEAMNYRIPFVTTDVGCVKEIVSPQQEAFMVPPQSVYDFAQALITLIQSSSDIKRDLTEKNYLKAKKFNLSTATEAFTHLFVNTKNYRLNFIN